jgi:SAM-dependent methyltransferase
VVALDDPLLDEVLATVDFERLGTLPRERKNAKWFNRPEKFLARALAEARAIGLDTGPPRRVLDLGAGPGYFLHVAQFFGHTALGLERAMAVCAPFHAWLGVDAVAGSVTARTPLQAFPDRFDVVTAQKIQFDAVRGPAGKRYWGVEEWGFLLDDLRANVLRPGGSVYLRLNKRNRRYTGPRFGDPELAADWAARGGVPAAPRRSTLFAPLLPGPHGDTRWEQGTVRRISSFAQRLAPRRFTNANFTPQRS